MVYAASQSVAARAAGRTKAAHIVDVLIEERAPTLSASPAWNVLRPTLYALLNYRRARHMADTIGPMPGRAALDWLWQDLSMKVACHHLERVPEKGPFFLVANHPTGIADGVAMFQALRRIRPDLMIYANSDAHRVCAAFGDVLIPVEWVPEKRTRERTRLTLKMTAAAIEDGRPIMIFPAGRLARIRPNKRLLDPEWQPSAVSLARKHGLPVLPCHVVGPYAFWFHFFDKFSKELRDITLFHELLNKHGRSFELRFGPMIAPELVSGDPTTTIRKLKHYVERTLPQAPDAPFTLEEPECDWRDPVPPPTSTAP